MKNIIILMFLLVTTFVSGLLNAQAKMKKTPYGSKETVGKYVDINGTQIYYEEYGTGEPMLLIHGNGASINAMGNQIDYFKTKYRVIIADSRGHGKSELKTDSLTYIQMAKDYAGLANHLNLDSLNIVGWSDGGIIGLLLGIHHPSKAKKIVTMGANLRPDSNAVYSWAVNEVRKQRQFVKFKIEESDTTKDWELQKQLLSLLGDQPNISFSDLSKIKSPVLIMAGDKDIIREEHTVKIYQNIPNAQLCIMPGETHFTPASNPELFNSVVEKFIENPFARPNSDWTK
ncbi:MAG: alpha/beta hydrolase [Ignavibacteriae bacterium]|nr:alpha/beta hydrolase [Ignavibacteriota bacterium]